MSKKIFIIIAVVLGVILTGLVGYYFLVRSNGASPSDAVTAVRHFFPFGGESATTTGGEVSRPTEDTTTPPQIDFQKKIREISANPVAGFGLFDSKAGTTIIYIEKATGHVYETELFSPQQTRLSNTTIPQVYEATWGNSTTSFIARYLESDNQTIDTYSLSIKPAIGTATSTDDETPYKTTGVLLSSDIKSISVNGLSMFYLTLGDNGSTGVISNLTGGNKKQIWNSLLREITPQYVNSSTVALTTLPYQNVNGFLYFLNTSNGSVKKIIGNIPGLSTLVSPDASQVLVLEQKDRDTLSAYTIADKSSVPVNPTTFPEKCVWSKKDKGVLYCAVPAQNLTSANLTEWYMGITQFTDNIWKYDIKNNVSTEISNLTDEAGEDIDVIHPKLSDNEEYLVFINKRDGSLWSLDVTK